MRGRTAVAAVAVALLGWLAVLPPAHAAEGAKLVLVMDLSGSMAQPLGGDGARGDTKIAAARRALDTTVSRLPADAQVGLRLYGATTSGRSKRSCTDSSLVVPVGGTPAALRGELARYRPQGGAPVAYAVRHAARDLGAAGQRSIVLVSDGPDSCDPDPCATVGSLAGRGTDLKVDVVGLRVTGRARDQLRCLAAANNGSYLDAGSAGELTDALDQLATRAFRPFRLSGTPVRGSQAAADAPVLRPGQYVDQLPARDRALYYRIPRTTRGSTLRVSFTTQVPRSASAAPVTLETPDGEVCASDVGLNYQGLTTTGVTSWNPDRSSPCNTADELLATVFAPVGDLARARFELLVTEEPPLRTARNLPAVADPTWRTLRPGRAVRAPVPGVSLSDAPVLAPGAYRTSIRAGEAQVFAVDLAWGQRLQAQVSVAPRRGELARALGKGDTLRLQVLGAGRAEYPARTIRKQPRVRSQLSPDGRTVVEAVGTSTIRYRNRTSSADRPGDIAGRQYLVLSRNQRDGAQPAVPYTLVVSVLGTAGQGGPDYVGSPAPASSPQAPATSAAPAGPAGDAGDAVSVTSSALPTVLVLGVGALVVAGSAIGTVLLLSRRRYRPRRALGR